MNPFANPVLKRDLTLFLRRPRAALLMMVYLGGLGLVLLAAWPAGETVDLGDTTKSRRLVDLILIAQLALSALITPTFAAASLTGEKERQTYEMLLASPLTPATILVGKFLGATAFQLLLLLASVPIVMLALPLGGVSAQELAVAYAVLAAAAAWFALIGMGAGGSFRRTSSALMTTYLLLLPCVLIGSGLWLATAGAGTGRIVFFSAAAPLLLLLTGMAVYGRLSRQLLYPDDLGSEGRTVIDERTEHLHAVGLVLQRDRFPDRLFAPKRRSTLLPDGADAVLDKELQSEIFGGGTLTMRIVIQVSLVLAVPLMGMFLFFQPAWAPCYVAYVLTFNLIAAPVFTAGAITGERERDTLELLLTTPLTAGAILRPKWLAGWRVSAVLTSFLTVPLFLAWLLVPEFHGHWGALLQYLLIVAAAGATASTAALFMSTVCRRTATALTASYLFLLLLYVVPLAVRLFASLVGGDVGPFLDSPWFTVPASFSPYLTVLGVPLDFGQGRASDLPYMPPNFLVHLGALALLNLSAAVTLGPLFRRNWERAADAAVG